MQISFFWASDRPDRKIKKKCASLVRGGIILQTRIVAEAARRHYPLERLFSLFFHVLDDVTQSSAVCENVAVVELLEG